jgi:IS5 family transposase
MREMSQAGNRYTMDGAGIPHCKSGMCLLLRAHDAKKGMKYVCPHRAGKADCKLAPTCDFKVTWLRPNWEYRQLGAIPRGSEEWNTLYDKRTSVERVNSRLKEHRRLNSHCHRGLDKVRIHSLMSVLALVVTALVKANDDRLDQVRTCTRTLR